MHKQNSGIVRGNAVHRDKCGHTVSGLRLSLLFSRDQIAINIKLLLAVLQTAVITWQLAVREHKLFPSALQNSYPVIEIFIDGRSTRIDISIRRAVLLA